MDAQRRRQILLLILLTISAVTTAFHYTDNFIHFDNYPAPDWITPNGVYISWLILTLSGVLGYFLYFKGNFWTAYLCLGIYSLTGITSTGHYLLPMTETFSLKMHVMIWLDAIAGILVLGFTFWSGLLLREWRQAIAD